MLEVAMGISVGLAFGASTPHLASPLPGGRDELGKGWRIPACAGMTERAVAGVTEGAVRG